MKKTYKVKPGEKTIERQYNYIADDEYAMIGTINLDYRSLVQIVLSEIDAQITGVYKNIFQIEESSSGSLRRHTFQYSDVLIGQVVIDELKDSFGVK